MEAFFDADEASLPHLLTEDELAAARKIKLDVEGSSRPGCAEMSCQSETSSVELVIEVPRLLAKQGQAVDDPHGRSNSNV
ncbi:hypothetical protein [Streptomyces soliscabiei]|uniref:hypothetical protein n=1 Tax=Streptomyces soliscabiei TaxID=588897 RepID=UPI0029AA5B7A|nr:hypothetical protein [Streptomyces sp. NY05-11A]MDX2676990.1 hypothetical protein [Streptomyces sp. NY05-11A]